MSLSSFITFTLLIGSGRNKPTLHHSFASVVSGGVWCDCDCDCEAHKHEVYMCQVRHFQRLSAIFIFVADSDLAQFKIRILETAGCCLALIFSCSKSLVPLHFLGLWNTLWRIYELADHIWNPLQKLSRARQGALQAPPLADAAKGWKLLAMYFLLRSINAVFKSCALRWHRMETVPAWNVLKCPEIAFIDPSCTAFEKSIVTHHCRDNLSTNLRAFAFVS